MEIKVFSLEEAVKYKPPKPTYVVSLRDDDSLYRNKELYDELEKTLIQPNIKVAKRYNLSELDTIDWYLPNNILERSIIDFKNENKDNEILLFHCVEGRSRSPAFAEAFNIIFHLNNDSKMFLPIGYKRHPYIYDGLLLSAKRLNLAL